MSRPRPIPSRCKSGPQRRVHFPPSPVLTRHYLAHSPSSYDRTPIAVEQNACALPARGCPGRTYMLTANERALRHPRSCTAYYYEEDDESSAPTTNNDEPTPVTAEEEATTVPPPPPLVPDLTSSDESDGMTSPPPDLLLHSSPPPIAVAKMHSSGTSDGLQTTSPGALSFLPHPPSTPDRARRRNRDRRSSPARDAVVAMLAAQRTAPEDTPEDAVDEEVVPSLTPSFKRLDPTVPTSALSACRLEDDDEGCLAGF